jgi:monovalent cation/hydrogen antiporter
MAFALGAIVSPTDAVSVNAITARLRVPNRVTTVLDGESLFNDATGLVAFKFALAAVVAGTFSLRAAAVDFCILAVGGFAIGFGAAYGIGKLRDLLTRLRSSDALIESTLSLMTPYAAYLAAERAGVSGVLAVVAAGLYSGWRDPVRMDAQARQTTWAVWSLVLFWLNGIAFVLLGLQFPSLLSLVGSHYSVFQLLMFTAVVAGTAMAVRIVWVFPAAYIPFLFAGVRKREVRPTGAMVFVVSWAGMRGTVTLAAALSIPLALDDGTPFPGRDIVIFLAFGVIVASLLVQGTTLEAVIRRLGLREDETRPKEEKLARMTAVHAGLQALRGLEKAAETPDHQAAIGLVIAEYEQRLSVLTAEGETQRSAHRRRSAGLRYQMAALEAERHALDKLWRSGAIIDEVYRPLQELLDYEESMLRGLDPSDDGKAISG